MTQDELLDKMAVLLGGRAAEWTIFHHLSTGAADDLAKVTDIARDMVTRFGMEGKLGAVSYESAPSPFLAAPLGFDAFRQRRYSDETAHAIDEAVQAIVCRAFDRTVAILAARRATLERGAKLLLERETLDEPALLLEGWRIGCRPGLVSLSLAVLWQAHCVDDLPADGKFRKPWDCKRVDHLIAEPQAPSGPRSKCPREALCARLLGFDVRP